MSHLLVILQAEDRAGVACKNPLVLLQSLEFCFNIVILMWGVMIKVQCVMSEDPLVSCSMCVIHYV